MAANEAKKEGASIPYTSFKTLMNTLDKMKEQGGAPSRIDRSYLSNMPGGERSIFTTGLKYLGLVNETLDPTDDLHQLVEAGDEQRRVLMRAIVERVYKEPLALPKRATQQQLEATFRGYGISGSTLRRAIGFFLNATEYAGIERSPHFKLPARERSTKPKVKPEPVMPESVTPKVDRTPHVGRHPLLDGLWRELPEPGQEFSQAKQDAWFAIAKHTFALLYKTGSDSTEARHEHSGSGGG